MALPVDIAWKRLALDEEMMWRPPEPGHPSLYPARWNPSITIFYSHPDPEALPPEYDDMSITYLKVVCSVTGTTLLSGDVVHGMPWPVDSPGAQLLATNLSSYFACYGALLEVDVVPYSAEHVEVGTYPYFLDFEPKKRELYEAVSESGETLSDSKETLSVRKSNTNLASQERAAGVLPSSVPEYKTELKAEYADVRSIDASREARETLSHTTQLSQMYQLLDAYHLGTNRALFFLQPRPHLADPKYQSFLEGPRRLEGVQEFFLVVAQPKTRAGFCVSAHLSTGHLAFGKTAPVAAGPVTKSVTQNVDYLHDPYWEGGPTGSVWEKEKRYELGDQLWPPGMPLDTATEVWIDTDFNKGISKGWAEVKDDSPPVLKGPGWTLRVDESQSKLLPDSVKALDALPDASGVTVTSQMVKAPTGETYESPEGTQEKTDFGRLKATLTVAFKVKTPAALVDGRETIDLFVRAKKVGACLDADGDVHPRPTDITCHTAAAKLGSDLERAREATYIGAVRALNDQIAEAMRDANESIAAHLYGTGPVRNPLHTDFVLRYLREALPLVRDSAWLQTPLAQLATVPVDLRPYLAELGIQDRRELLESPVRGLRARLREAGAELDELQLRELYLNAWDIATRGDSG